MIKILNDLPKNDINLMDRNGNTLLMLAVKLNHTKLEYL